MVSGLQIELNADFKKLTVTSSAHDVSNIQCYKVGRQFVVTGWIELQTSSTLLFQVRKASFDLPDLVQEAYSYLMSEDGSYMSRVTIGQNASYIQARRIAGSFPSGKYYLHPIKALFVDPDYLFDVNDNLLLDANGEPLIGG